MSLQHNSTLDTAGIIDGHVALPLQPVVSVRADRRSWINARLLWEYRDLLWFLTVRDIKVRYKQTALGVVWVVLQPLVTMAIFSVIFGRLANVPSDGVPYPLFAFAGLLPWLYFASSVSNASNSLIGSASLVSKVYFPKLLLPAAAVGAAVVDLGISTILLAALMAVYGQAVSVQVLMLVPLTLLLVVLVLAVGMMMSALNVKYRDIRYVIPFCLQLGMFVTPVIFPLSWLPAKWQPWMCLNPMTGIVSGMRASLFGLEIPWHAISLSVGVTGILLVVSIGVFRHMERSFADVI